MFTSEFKFYSRASKTILSIVCLAAAAFVIYAIVSTTQLSFSNLSILFSSMFICILGAQYELRVPRTEIEISIGSIIAIWGVLWLGHFPGILLCTVAALTSLFREQKTGPGALSKACLTITAFSVATLANFAYTPISADLQRRSSLELYPTAANVVSIAVGSLLVFSFIDLIIRLSTGPLNRRYAVNSANRLLGAFPVIVVTVILCLLFEYFGLAFGLVVVPFAVFAILAYRIHLKRLQQKTAQILEASRVHLATVEALATAIDARDQIGNGHVRRTQIYAVSTGEALGLSSDEINALQTGALLHDIGKLAVPDSILSKAGRLTTAEIEKTKIHSSVGASILENVGFSYPVVPTIRNHHEFWDGSGYPDGLSGVSIPITARILAIADAYDTLRSDRPFRSAVSREDARAHLLQKSGTQFDPSIVSVFLKKLGAFEAEIEAAGLSYESDARPSSPLLAINNTNYVEHIKLANKEVYTLFEMAREFGSATDLDGILHQFSTKVMDLVPSDTCAIYLLDETGVTAQALSVSGAHADVLSSRRIKVGEGATGMALKGRELVKNVNPDLDFSLPQLELIQQYSTMASMPLIAENKLLGAVSIYSFDMPEYAEEHFRVLDAIAKIAAEAIGKTQQHDEARSNSLTDAMTGLPNARSLVLQFEKEVGRADRSESAFQVLVLDLDGFKAVNDTYGHTVGDSMLRAIGQVIQGQLRDYDFLSRYGGDEFVALVPDTSSDDAAELCSRIEMAVGEFKLHIDSDTCASVGVSVGAAGYTLNGETFDDIIAAADRAMYKSKSSRKLNGTAERRSEPRQSPTLFSAPDDVVDAQIVENFENCGLIVELDESHVLASASIN